MIPEGLRTWFYQCWCYWWGGHTFEPTDDVMATWYGYCGPGECTDCGHSARIVDWYDPQHESVNRDA